MISSLGLVVCKSFCIIGFVNWLSETGSLQLVFCIWFNKTWFPRFAPYIWFCIIDFLQTSSSSLLLFTLPQCSRTLLSHSTLPLCSHFYSALHKCLFVFVCLSLLFYKLCCFTPLLLCHSTPLPLCCSLAF